MTKKVEVYDNFLNKNTKVFKTDKEADAYTKTYNSVNNYVDDIYEYLYNHEDKIELNGKIYDAGFLSRVLDYLMENNSKVNAFVKEYQLYDVSDRPLAAVVVMFVREPFINFKKIAENAIVKVKEQDNLKEREEELARQAKIQNKINRINKQRAGALKGFKTATYGRKGHRDNITQLENSVRRMF